jgi:hypothetical protein
LPPHEERIFAFWKADEVIPVDEIVESLELSLSSSEIGPLRT